jgi:hypothetical protein
MSSVEPDTRDWQLSDYADPTLTTNGIQILVALDGSTCLVIYPWFYTLPEVQPALEQAKCMGFTHISEYGNLYPYAISPDTDDADFIMLEVDK